MVCKTTNSVMAEECGDEIKLLISEILSEILDVVAKNLANADKNDIKRTEENAVLNSNVLNDVQQSLNQLLDQIDEKDTSIGRSPAGNISLRSLNRNFLLPPNLKSLSYLGISQTGRIMDPICLQQNIFTSIAAENLVEYQWPPDSSGDYYMLQEQVSTFLNIKSFKRKYPGIERRKLDPNEVNHLLTTHVISEVQVTLGLTALRSADVCDLMMKEYPDKYVEYSGVMQEREKQKMRNKYKQYASSASMPVEKSQNYLKRAMRQAASYNAHINRQRREDFSVYYDMSTNVLQYPKTKVRKVDSSLTRPSLYPCALIPGQFQEYYHSYTRDELMYLPLNTSLYGPPQPPPNIEDDNISGFDSESAEESDGSVSSVSRSVKSISSSKVKAKAAEISKETMPEIVSEESNSKSNTEEGVTKDEESEALESEIEKLECGICLQDENANKKGEPERLIKCSQCDNRGHPSCLEMSDELVSVVETYNWQCMECKTCTICSLPHREDLMMFCDRCDRGYHTFCVSLRTIPSGVWACSQCIYADPDFVKRKRKRLRASVSPSGRGKRRRRKQSAKNNFHSQPEKNDSPLEKIDPTSASPTSPRTFGGLLERIRSASVDEKENEQESKLEQAADSGAKSEKPPTVTIKISLPTSSESKDKNSKR